jgi:Flp pilus assembly protein TadG
MRGTFSSIRKLVSDQRGTSLLEFAFVAPILAMMVVGVGDLARGFSERFALQQAVDRTLEMAHLGTRQDNYEFLRTEAAQAATDAGKTGATVTLSTWLDCINASGVKTKSAAAWTETCASTEETARYVSLTLSSTFTPSFGTAGYPGAVNGSVPISASSSVRVQ